jgi:hypothetical protein
MSCADLTIKSGRPHLFHWIAPEPVAVDSTPTLTVDGPDDESVVGFDPLAVVVAPGTVSSISDDRRRLTLTAAIVGDRARAAGEKWGAAFLVSPAAGTFTDIRVTEISPAGTVITIDGLPRHVDVTGARIEWASWWTRFTSGDVAAEARRDLTWTVTYTPLHAGTADEQGEAWEDGRLIVATRPFDTRVTDRDIAGRHHDLASTKAGRDNSRSSVIAAARDELALLIVPHIAPRGLHLDQLDGRAFAPAHIDLAAALIVARQEPDRAAELRERAASLVEMAVQCAWHDLDSDGEIDAGEEGQRGTVSLRATRLSTLFPNTHPRPTSPRWYRGRSH